MNVDLLAFLHSPKIFYNNITLVNVHGSVSINVQSICVKSVKRLKSCGSSCKLVLKRHN